MFLAPLTAVLTTIKHCQFGHRCPAVINDGNKADGGKPAGSSVERPAETASQAEAAHVERVTEKKANDPKMWRPGVQATARIASGSHGITTSTSQRSCQRRHVCTSSRTHERPEPNWIPWIIGACLKGGSLAYVFAGENMRLRASPASGAACPSPKVQDNLPQLKACPDPLYME